MWVIKAYNVIYCIAHIAIPTEKSQLNICSPLPLVDCPQITVKPERCLNYLVNSQVM